MGRGVLKSKYYCYFYRNGENMLHYCCIKNCCFLTTFFPLSIKLFSISYLIVFSEILQIDRNLETEKSDTVDFPEQFFFALKWA